MSGPNSRKRPAPGSSPIGHIPQMQQPFNSAQPDQRTMWAAGAGTGVGTDGANFGDATSRNANQYGAMMSPLQNSASQFGQGVPASSMALARRGLNQALIPSGVRSFDPNSDSWTNFPDNATSFLPQATETTIENDSIEALEERAKRVMRDAGGKARQIPPFVQKLASFLESSQNTDLIRWNDAGDGFIVLDEDEFARKLIPEYFKHKNYASFVRQLNMYGFHKRVGLSDNSMKASERKNKAPSEYYNPFFRRDHPNLLYLINKPKSGKKGGKKDETGGGGSDDDGAEEIFSGNAANGVNDVGALQKKDIVQVRTQLEKLQQQQNAISAMLGQMRKEHSQLFQQAIAFQDQHSRHENSINAILNFLANVFRKSLEEQGGAQSMQELLASIIPNAQAHSQTQIPQQGSVVVDLDDLFNQQTTPAANMSPPKRQQRLLLPPTMQAGKARTVSPSSTAPTTPQVPYQGHPMGSVTEVLDTSPSDTTSPAYMKSELQSNPRQGMMKIIQDTNAGSDSTAHIDLPKVAANTSATLTNDQRAKMLDIMSGSTQAAAPSIPAASPPSAPSPGLGQNAGTSLSPILSSMPPPNMEDLQARSEQLDALQRLTHGTANSIAELTNILGPLSPSGKIPGLDENGNPNPAYFDNVEFDQFLDNNAFSDLNYDPNFATPALDGADGSDFNFNLDGNNEYGVPGGTGGTSGGYEPGKVLEGTDTPSPAGTEEIGDFRQNNFNSPERDAKRRRRV